MERGDRVPICASEQAARPEQGPLNEDRSRMLGLRGDRPLELRVAGEEHLGTQSQQTLRFEGFDPPEVDDVTYT